MTEQPVPPFPQLGNPILEGLVLAALDGKTVSDGIRRAVWWAVINAWYEGHIEGEDACPGCTYRGDSGPGGPSREQVVRQWFDRAGY